MFCCTTIEPSVLISNVFRRPVCHSPLRGMFSGIFFSWGALPLQNPLWSYWCSKVFLHAHAGYGVMGSHSCACACACAHVREGASAQTRLRRRACGVDAPAWTSAESARTSRGARGARRQPSLLERPASPGGWRAQIARRQPGTVPSPAPPPPRHGGGAEPTRERARGRNRCALAHRCACSPSRTRPGSTTCARFFCVRQRQTNK